MTHRSSDLGMMQQQVASLMQSSPSAKYYISIPKIASTLCSATNPILDFKIAGLKLHAHKLLQHMDPLNIWFNKHFSQNDPLHVSNIKATLLFTHIQVVCEWFRWPSDLQIIKVSVLVLQSLLALLILPHQTWPWLLQWYSEDVDRTKKMYILKQNR